VEGSRPDHGDLCVHGGVVGWATISAPNEAAVTAALEYFTLGRFRMVAKNLHILSQQ
jgi:hypothetical protein